MSPPIPPPRHRNDQVEASAPACPTRSSPFSAEELRILDRLRALKEEWRALTAPEGHAGTDAAAREARLRDIDTEAGRLRAEAADARRRRMIALGHQEPDGDEVIQVQRSRR